MKKKNSNKKPRNKWKIVAIISLVINALVVLLLVVGLATPKAKYVSVHAQSTDATAYIYKNSNNINPLDYDWSSFSDEVRGVPGVVVYGNAYRVHFHVTPSGYLDDNGYFNTANEVIFWFYNGVSDDASSERYLKYISIQPVNSTPASYYVFTSNWTDISVNHTETYRELGYTSPYLYINNTIDSVVKSVFDAVFSFVGDNAVIDEYLITDNFNPNKYMSMNMDSIGLLYESAYSYGSLVKWSSPTYQGVVSGSKVSTLGFLEIPLFFTSNNENFLGIRMYFDVVQSYLGTDNEVHYIDYGNSVVNNKYHYTFVYMSYYYEPTSALGTIPYNISEKVVCAVPVYTTTADFIQNNVEYRNYTYEPFESYNWLSQEYKKIGVYGASQYQLNSVGISYPLNVRSLAINNLTIREILLYDMSINPGNINTGGGNIGNVFSLIRLAFDSLTGVLAISIVPGLSIGILFFLPLVLTIIIVIIKLVKR